MAVSVYGDTSSDNYQAALALRPVLEELLGPSNEARMVVGAFTPGCSVQDTDLLVLGLCRVPVVVPPDLVPVDLHARPVKLSNFALAIEVKGHPPEAVRFEGNQVLVRYRNRATNEWEWHGATDQNLKQVHSLKSYIERHKARSPFWLTSIWLRNVPPAQLPKNQSNLLGARIEPRDLLRVIINQRIDELRKQVTKPWQAFFARCSHDDDAREVQGAIELFTRRLEASPLDREKFERIRKRTVEPELPEYLTKLGSQLLVFRGRGGAGKTVRLLQLAYRLREDRGARVLFLTYNRALAADLRRLIHLMGIREHALDEPTVSIWTSEKFFWGLLSAWELAPAIEEGEPFPEEEFQKNKLALRDLFRGESSESLRTASGWKENPSLVNWDFVMVDEAQDWPNEERDILSLLFGANRLVIADGVDQLVRRDGRCDWTILADSASRQVVSLRKSLRLKSNLCSFIEAFVDAAKLEWDLAVNDEVFGGRVIVVRGGYSKSVHQRVMDDHVRAGHKPVDALFCVTAGGGAAGGRIAQDLEQWGEKVWDGSREAIRETFPESIEQYRIVKYESCRGLEGWTVVCLDFDRFVQRQFMEGRKRPKELFDTGDDVARRYSGRWGMIPMTRAIDTLVLQVSGDGPTSRLLADLARGRDYVELVDGQTYHVDTPPPASSGEYSASDDMPF